MEEEVPLPTFEGYEDTWCSQWLIERWIPKREAGQCQEDVDRPQTVQLHLRPTSSHTHTHQECLMFKSLWEQEEIMP